MNNQQKYPNGIKICIYDVQKKERLKLRRNSACCSRDNTTCSEQITKWCLIAALTRAVIKLDVDA